MTSFKKSKSERVATIARIAKERRVADAWWQKNEYQITGVDVEMEPLGDDAMDQEYIVLDSLEIGVDVEIDGGNYRDEDGELMDFFEMTPADELTLGPRPGIETEDTEWWHRL